MEHKDESIEMVQAVDKDSDVAITEVTSPEELQLGKVADIFENLVTGKARTSLFCQFHAIVLVTLETNFQLFIIHRLVK